MSDTVGWPVEIDYHWGYPPGWVESLERMADEHNERKRIMSEVTRGIITGFHSGTSQKGNPYTMVFILLDDGTKISGFEKDRDDSQEWANNHTDGIISVATAKACEGGACAEGSQVAFTWKPKGKHNNVVRWVPWDNAMETERGPDAPPPVEEDDDESLPF